MVIGRYKIKSPTDWEETCSQIQEATRLFRGEISDTSFNLRTCFMRYNVLSVVGRLNEDTTIDVEISISTGIIIFCILAFMSVLMTLDIGMIFVALIVEGLFWLTTLDMRNKTIDTFKNVFNGRE